MCFFVFVVEMVCLIWLNSNFTYLSFEGLCGWVHRDSSGGGVGEGTCVAVGTGSGGADVAAESHLAAVIGKSSGGTNLISKSKRQVTRA